MKSDVPELRKAKDWKVWKLNSAIRNSVVTSEMSCHEVMVAQDPGSKGVTGRGNVAATADLSFKDQG